VERRAVPMRGPLRQQRFFVRLIVAGITGMDNIFKGVVTDLCRMEEYCSIGEASVFLRLPPSKPIGKPVAFVICQESMEIHSASSSCSTNRLRGHVQRIRRRGQGL
jgi:hypothetical protein